MLVDTVMACPADLVSSGNISLGINHPSGPHDHANDDTYTHMNTTANHPSADDIVFPCKLVAKITATATCTQIHQHSALVSCPCTRDLY
jgi:hypothetical protein